MVNRFTRLRSLLIGTVVAALFAAGVGFAFNATSGAPWADKTFVKAQFTDVGGLREDDDVRIARVRVGRVADIKLENGTPTVTMQLDREYEIYRNASAVVQDRSALGQRIVELNTGTPDAGELAPGERIPVEQTSPAQDISDLFDVFDKPTREGLRSTLREVGGGMYGHSQDFQDFLRAAPEELRDLGTVSRALSVGNGRNTAALLQAANTLSQRFAGRQHEITELMGQLRTTFYAIGVDRGVPLAETLQRAPETLRAARQALRATERPLNNLTTAADHLRPGTHALGDATPNLRGALRDSLPPLNKLPGVSQQAAPAVADLSQVVHDARPFVPRAAKALHSADPLLSTLAPYAPEIAGFFDNFASALSQGDGTPGRYLRVHLILAPEMVDGQAGLTDPFMRRNPYPEPGEAATDRAGPSVPNVGGGR